MHIDMDCFFVAVSLIKYPELRGKPVAVAHYAWKSESSEQEMNRKKECQERKIWAKDEKDDNEESKKKKKKTPLSDDTDDDEDKSKGLPENGDDGKSDLGVKASERDNFWSLAEIASCSYEARDAGVKNGMIMRNAKELCPELRTIPYDFDGYYKVSKLLYETVARYTHDIEACSCDELLVDITKILQETGATPLEFAQVLRGEIHEKTQCTASAGLAPTAVLARLGTRVAKPNGVYQLVPGKEGELLNSLPVRELPGVGGSISKKLQTMGIHTCADLQQLTLDNLQTQFGSKTGHIIYQHCRGEDDRPIRMEKERKYVSVEVNYGIRFKVEADVLNFIFRLSQELHKRLHDLEMAGRTLTVKLKVRRAGTPKEDTKFMGYGVYDNKIRSATLPQETDDLGTIRREYRNILLQMNATPTDIRGVGVQISRLKKASCSSKLSKSLEDLLVVKSDAAKKKAVRNIREDSANSGSSLSSGKKRGKSYSLLNFIKPKKRILAKKLPSRSDNIFKRERKFPLNMLSGATITPEPHSNRNLDVKANDSNGSLMKDTSRSKVISVAKEGGIMANFLGAKLTENSSCGTEDEIQICEHVLEETKDESECQKGREKNVFVGKENKDEGFCADLSGETQKVEDNSVFGMVPNTPRYHKHILPETSQKGIARHDNHEKDHVLQGDPKPSDGSKTESSSASLDCKQNGNNGRDTLQSYWKSSDGSKTGSSHASLECKPPDDREDDDVSQVDPECSDGSKEVPGSPILKCKSHDNHHKVSVSFNDPYCSDGSKTDSDSTSEECTSDNNGLRDAIPHCDPNYIGGSEIDNESISKEDEIRSDASLKNDPGVVMSGTDNSNMLVRSEATDSVEKSLIPNDKHQPGIQVYSSKSDKVTSERKAVQSRSNRVKYLSMPLANADDLKVIAGIQEDNSQIELHLEAKEVEEDDGNPPEVESLKNQDVEAPREDGYTLETTSESMSEDAAQLRDNFCHKLEEYKDGSHTHQPKISTDQVLIPSDDLNIALKAFKVDNINCKILNKKVTTSSSTDECSDITLSKFGFSPRRSREYASQGESHGDVNSSCQKEDINSRSSQECSVFRSTQDGSNPQRFQESFKSRCSQDSLKYNHSQDVSTSKSSQDITYLSNHQKDTNLRNQQEDPNGPKIFEGRSIPGSSQVASKLSGSLDGAYYSSVQGSTSSTSSQKGSYPSGSQDNSIFSDSQGDLASRDSQGDSNPNNSQLGSSTGPSLEGFSPSRTSDPRIFQRSADQRGSQAGSNINNSQENLNLMSPGEDENGILSEEESDRTSSRGSSTKLSLSTGVSSSKKSKPFSHTSDPEFLADFYNHSRYHHMATWRVEHKNFVNDLQKKVEVRKLPGKEKLQVLMNASDKEEDLEERSDGFIPAGYSLPSQSQVIQERGYNCKRLFEEKSVIMHIDMDCFFVAVSLLKFPELRGKALAVAHSTVNTSPRMDTWLEDFERAYLEKKMWTCPTAKTIDTNSDDENSHKEEISGREVSGVAAEEQGMSEQRVNSEESMKIRQNIDTDHHVSSQCKKDDLNKESGIKGLTDTSDGEERTSKDVKMEISVGSCLQHNPLAEIASCSYEARAFGVEKGMILSRAKELCPHIVTIPYDFENYHRVSRILYETVASFTNEIEAVSCDEMFVDVTKTLRDTGASPVEFAQLVLDEVFAKTQCIASVGIASNTLLARLCTRVAKPNGIYMLMDDDKVEEFMKNIPVRELPGVGRATSQKLMHLGITTCSDLQELSLSALQCQFGQKPGHDLFHRCRGKNDQPVRMERQQKLVSSTVNYGIRFKGNAEALKFVADLAEVVHKKLKKTGMAGRTIMLKAKIRKRGSAEDNKKLFGHGICDNRSRTLTFTQETDDLAIIQKECQNLLLQLKASPRDIRGVGIHISRLKRASKSSNSAKSLKDMLVKKGSSEVTKTSELTKKRSEVTESSKLNVTKSLKDMLIKKRSEVAQPSELVSKRTEAKNFQPSTAQFANIDTNFLPLIKAEPEPEAETPSSPVFSQDGALAPFLKPVSMFGPKPNMSKRRVLSTGDLPLDYPSCLDPDVLKELPPDILKEVLEEERLKVRKAENLVETLGHVDDLPSFSEIDPTCLDALPTDIQGELLSAYRRRSSNTSEMTPEKIPEVTTPEKRVIEEDLKVKKKKRRRDGSQSGSGRSSVQRNLFEVMNIQQPKGKARRHSALY
ncbi:uncharacterized protein [Apostichopus japonicus]